MAINISQIVLILHISVIVFSIIGIVASCFRFGFDKKSYGLIEYEDLVAPDLPDPPDTNSSDSELSDYSGNRYLLFSQYTSRTRRYAKYQFDPQSYVMIPFALTLFMSSYFMVMRILASGTYKSTSMLNCTVVLWFITLVYTFLYNVTHTYNDANLDEYYIAWLSTVFSMNTSLMVLLFILIAACGRCLRVFEIKWPRCNLLKLFTLDFIIAMTRLAFTIIIAMIFDYNAGRGLEIKNSEYCVHGYFCKQKKYSAWLYYSSLTLLLMNILVSSEHLLSLIWGKNNRTHDISAGLLSFVSCLFISFSASFIEEMNNDVIFEFLTVSTIFNMFHTWTIWSNWKFMISPPKILKMVCGRGTNTDEGEASADGVIVPEGLSRESTAEREPSASGAIVPEGPIESTDEGEASANEATIPEGHARESTAAVDRVTSERVSSDSINKSRCLIVNVFLTGFSVTGLILSIISSNYVMTPVMCSFLIKAFTAIVTVLTIGVPPPQNATQVWVEIILESIVLIVAIIVTFCLSFLWDSSVRVLSDIVGALSIVVLLIKIVEAFKKSPIQTILEMINSSQTLTAPNNMGGGGTERMGDGGTEGTLRRAVC